MIIKRPQNTSPNDTASEPAQTFNQFFNGKAFRDMVRQSDNDQKEMIAQAEKIEKNQKTAKAAVPTPKPAKSNSKAS